MSASTYYVDVVDSFFLWPPFSDLNALLSSANDCEGERRAEPPPLPLLVLLPSSCGISCDSFDVVLRCRVAVVGERPGDVGGGGKDMTPSADVARCMSCDRWAAPGGGRKEVRIGRGADGVEGVAELALALLLLPLPLPLLLPLRLRPLAAIIAVVIVVAFGAVVDADAVAAAALGGSDNAATSASSSLGVGKSITSGANGGRYAWDADAPSPPIAASSENVTDLRAFCTGELVPDDDAELLPPVDMADLRAFSGRERVKSERDAEFIHWVISCSMAACWVLALTIASSTGVAEDEGCGGGVLCPAAAELKKSPSALVTSMRGVCGREDGVFAFVGDVTGGVTDSALSIQMRSTVRNRTCSSSSASPKLSFSQIASCSLSPSFREPLCRLDSLRRSDSRMGDVLTHAETTSASTLMDSDSTAASSYDAWSAGRCEGEGCVTKHFPGTAPLSAIGHA